MMFGTEARDVMTAVPIRSSKQVVEVASVLLGVCTVCFEILIGLLLRNSYRYFVLRHN